MNTTRIKILLIPPCWSVHSQERNRLERGWRGLRRELEGSSGKLRELKPP